MLQLHNLESLTKDRKRTGRGGSRGGTSGRGHKGQRSRSGGKSNIRASFEGGQMPLSRRLPKRGFNNIFKKDFQLVSLQDLEIKFAAGDTVDKESLMNNGLIKHRKGSLIKILANGELTKKLIINVNAFSKSAVDAISKAGGEAKVV